MRIWRGAVFAIACLAAVGATTGAVAGTQVDYLYSEWIDNQEQQRRPSHEAGRDGEDNRENRRRRS